MIRRLVTYPRWIVNSHELCLIGSTIKATNPFLIYHRYHSTLEQSSSSSSSSVSSSVPPLSGPSATTKSFFEDNGISNSETSQYPKKGLTTSTTLKFNQLQNSYSDTDKRYGNGDAYVIMNHFRDDCAKNLLRDLELRHFIRVLAACLKSDDEKCLRDAAVVFKTIKSKNQMNVKVYDDLFSICAEYGDGHFALDVARSHKASGFGILSQQQHTDLLIAIAQSVAPQDFLLSAGIIQRRRLPPKVSISFLL